MARRLTLIFGETTIFDRRLFFTDPVALFFSSFFEMPPKRVTTHFDVPEIPRHRAHVPDTPNPPPDDVVSPVAINAGRTIIIIIQT